MKKLITVLGLAILTAGSGCLEKTGGGGGQGTAPLLRYHFVGFTAFGQATNNAQLKKIASLTATAALRQQIAQKLATAPSRYWQKHLPAGAGDQAALFQPLWDDLLSSESFAEVRGSASRPQLILAAALPDERARLWSTNLWKIAAAWKLGTPQPAAIAGGSGWETTKGGVTLQVVQAGKWLLLALGQERAAPLTPLLQQLGAGASPFPAAKNHLVDFEADFPRWSGLFPGWPDFRLPLTHLTVTNRGEALRTEARLTFSEKLAWTFEPWRIPTNLISEPINSFTVAQGIAPLVPQLYGVPSLGLKSYPNQFCSWGQGYDQVRTFLTVPMPGATNAMNQLSKTLPTFVSSWFKDQTGEMYYVSNRAEFIWQVNPPFITPFIRAAKLDDQEYLYAGLLATPKQPKPLPPDLFSQLAGRTNLLYYDFELTGERLVHGNQCYQLADMIQHRLVVVTNVPTQAWLMAAVPLLGPTITEVTQTGPRELTLVRKSHLGLAGFELATLMRWIESPGFPFRFEASTAVMRDAKPKAAAKATNSPPARKP